MKLMRLILVLLVLSLLLQNTCPHGFAAKTAFAAAKSNDCPFKKCQHVPQNSKDTVDDNTNRPLYPAFVFAIQEIQSVTLVYWQNSVFRPFSADFHKDPFKEPLIKPPAV